MMGMVPFDKMPSAGKFPLAFHSGQSIVLAEITALGEILALPVVGYLPS